MELNDVFKVGGLLNKKFPQYQAREGQVKMATLIKKALEEEKSAVIEGATGIGKGFAYLIPLILSGERAIISTSNKSLQDQLNNKDLPILKEALGKDFKWTVLKGKNNYFCYERFQTNKEDIKTELLRDNELDISEDLLIQNIGKWAEKEEVGDLEYLPFEIPYKVKEMIACSPHIKHEKDSDGEKFCFATQAKIRSRTSQIILVNHTLLALDINLKLESEGKAKILPDTNVVIVDEAHEFRRSAFLAFSDEISLNSLYHLLNWSLVKKKINRKRASTLVQELKKALDSYLPEKNGNYYTQSKVSHFKGLERVIEGLFDIIKAVEGVKSENPRIIANIQEITKEAKHLQKRLDCVTEEDGNMLRWVEARDSYNDRTIIKFKSAPLDISHILKQGFFDEKTVIFTSATLAVHNSFEFFKEQMGIPDDCLELIAESPFDYKKQALVYISDGTEEKLFEIQELLKMSKGRAFILFTSYKDMNYMYDIVDTEYPKLLQGKDRITRVKLLEEFNNTPNAVLFGTKSFWEGVDVQGDKLSLVIIFKIPFENPKDLMFSSICEQIDAKAGKRVSFIKYAIPDACLKLKQGVGRLIRSTEDTGVIALLDARINHARYKDMILNTFPPAYRTQKLEKVDSFFKKIDTISYN